MIKSINELIADYYKWLKDNTAILTDNTTGWSLISTPFVGLFNDHIQIYAKHDGKNIKLSDDGETFNNLDLIGVSINRSESRKEIVNTILRNYGVKTDYNELMIECDETNFAKKKHNLLMAIIEISGLYVLSKPNVSHLFKEDVRQYLEELNVNYTSDFISKGVTGLEFTFDFQIAKKTKEIVIKSFNSFDKIHLPAFLFSWQDIRPVREKASKKQVIAIAIVNDEKKEVKNDFINALNTIGADYIPWSERYSNDNKNKIIEQTA